MMFQQPLVRPLFHKEIQMHRPLTRLIPSRPMVFAITGCICIVAWTALSGERDQESPHRIPLAVIDVAKVFKEVRPFNDKMQHMKIEVADYDRNVRARRSEHSDQLSPGLKAEVEAKKATFLSDEALVYANTYREIEKVVESICRERDIGIVIRFSSDPMNSNDRTSVLQAVNRPVVYTAVPDLTADVVTALNKSGP
jgi:hypothetical protein